MVRDLGRATVSTNWTLPRESEEWVGPLTVTVNGAAITAFTVAVVAVGARPASWLAPDLLGGLYGVLVGPGGTWPLTAGSYAIWVKVTAAGESPVLDNAGSIIIT